MARHAAPTPAQDDDPPWPDHVMVTRPEAVQLLVDRKAMRHLIPFQQRAHTLTTAARALEVPTSTMAYWIPKLLGVGLLVRLGDEARAGMASPRYRAVARQLRVRYGSIPVDRRVALFDEARYVLMRRFLDGIDERFASDPDFAFSIEPYQEGGSVLRMVETEEQAVSRGYTDAWHTLRLTSEEARRLASELEAVLERYRTNPQGHTHVVHVGVAPEPRVRWRSASD